jgi:ParB-like chromosome segregation protein Spo0J
MTRQLPTHTYTPIRALKPYPRNARTHTRKQIGQIADSISAFGFTNPVLIDEDGQIMAGHGRVDAAKLLGLKEVPTLRFDHLSEAQKRAYILADNRIAENAGWDSEILSIELVDRLRHSDPGISARTTSHLFVMVQLLSTKGLTDAGLIRLG